MYDLFALQKWIREQKMLTPSEKYIALLISTFRNNTNGDCFPNQVTLSLISGYRRETVNKLIKALVRKGVLTIQRVELKASRHRVRNFVFCMK